VRLVNGRIELSLAESIEPNRDATQWTIRVRPDVTFHDGRPLTSEDVAATFRLIGDPEKNQNAALFTDLDLAAIKALDGRTVRVPLKRARGDFVEGILALSSPVYPAGVSDFAKPVGSGPFRLVSSQPGGPVELVAYKDYWGGVPSISELEIRPINDPEARLNAVRAGQIDYAIGITPTGAATAATDGNVQVIRGGAASSNALIFAMNVTQSPFDDPDVRMAFRLAIDREALIESVLFGQGEIGNDIAGKGLPGYNDALPQRRRDVPQARKLLADAGVTEVTMRAADVVPGLVDAAGLYARQLGEVGVELKIDRAAADSYFDDFERVLSTPFQTFFEVNRPAVANIVTFTGSGSDFNITGIADRAYDAKLGQAFATVDDAQRAERIKEVQQILYERGGEIVWAFAEQLDASRPGIQGVQPSSSGTSAFFAKARFT
jgi:peptide/nickel transport system substrate-binding protein